MDIHIHPVNLDGSVLISLFASNESTKPIFTFLIDPWLTETLTDPHPLILTQSHGPETPPPISSLASLPHPPDAVILTQSNSDHVTFPTLSTLASTTAIFAIPAAATIVKSWNHFDASAIHTITTQTQARTTIVLPENAGVIELVHLPALRFWEQPALYSFTSIRILPASLPPFHIVYTAHGAPNSAITALLASLPDPTVNVLFHPLVKYVIPYIPGGKVVPGAEGAEALLKEVKADYFIGVHDEKKLYGGFIGKVIQAFDAGEEEIGGIEVWRFREGGWKFGFEDRGWRGGVSEEWDCCKPKDEGVSGV
ncbi:hypothetical protein BJ508DRAFT_335001 [Ascobolus immersus RN42]|uniref:Metallo-beta-lactamase domain-containing protein n=1 Tax=Ascobolus immersus RN42 TaxID=1160509 RepID=A0A3N4HJY8_ASCIM|nr:hypothetical protein BJ508DRAFT_335001 [Ascobolus immersus RN42]